MAQLFARWLYVSKAWRELRFNLIIERGPVCQRCSKVVIDTSKLVGHHKITLSPANITDINITLNKDNVELICSRCHDAVHKRYGYNQHNVYIVYGSPLSGKNTFVNQLSSIGDMVLDIDRLYECISGQALYDNPPGKWLFIAFPQTEGHPPFEHTPKISLFSRHFQEIIKSR